MTSPNLTTAKSLSKDSTTEGCSGKTDYCSTSDMSTEESKWSSLFSSHFPMRIPPKKVFAEGEEAACIIIKLSMHCKKSTEPIIEMYTQEQWG